jgi:hypothetical protein
MSPVRRFASVRARFERLIGDGASLGTGCAYLTLLTYACATHWHLGWIDLPEGILLAVMGSGLGLVLEPIDLLVIRGGYVWLPVVVAALAWRRTRPLSTVAVGVVLVVEGARLAALGCFSVYVMDHRLGLLSVPLALLPTVLLARRRWPLVSSIVIAVGLCVGVGLGVVFQHDYPAVVSPLQRFVPIAGVTLVIAWLISRWIPAAPPASRLGFIRLWGVSAFSVSCLFIIAITTDRLAPQEPPPHRFLPDSSYDLHIIGAPPELLWTDTEQVHIVTNPYGDRHDNVVLTGGDHATPQRIWISPTDGFYVQMLRRIGRWTEPPAGQPVAQDPVVAYRDDRQDGSPCAFVEDPLTRMIFMMSQWRSFYFVMERDSGIPRSSGRFSNAFMGAWHSTPVLASRIAYVSSGLEDGGLYELDLDSMEVTRRAAGVYLYETVLDPPARVLWGARPVTGEVIGVDSDTFGVRYRIRTGFGSRDVQRDPRTGDLYSCSLFGDVFRIAAPFTSAERIAWCGRVCRNLYLDTQQDTLWAATDDGICGIPLPGATAPEPR